MVPHKHYHRFKIRLTHPNPNPYPMMTRRRTRRDLPRPSHKRRTKKHTLRNNTIYRIRSFLLSGVFLNLISRKPCPNPRVGSRVAPNWNYPTKPTRSPTTQHSSPIILRRHRNMITSRNNARKQKRSNIRPNNYHRTRHLLHSPSAFRIYRNPIYNLRQRLRLIVLRSYRLPRVSRNNRNHIPNSMPSTPHQLPLHNITPLRI